MTNESSRVPIPPLFTGAAQCLLRLSPAARPFVVLKASEFRHKDRLR